MIVTLGNLEDQTTTKSFLAIFLLYFRLKGEMNEKVVMESWKNSANYGNAFKLWDRILPKENITDLILAGVILVMQV